MHHPREAVIDGQEYYDTDLGKILFWNGRFWQDHPITIEMRIQKTVKTLQELGEPDASSKRNRN